MAMALAIDSASKQSDEGDGQRTFGELTYLALSCTDGMCGSGRLCGIFAVERYR